MARDPYKYFRIEGQELVEALGRGLLDLEKQPNPATVQQLLYRAHTLKGAARVVKHTRIGDLAHHLEDLLAVNEARPMPDREDVDQAMAAVDQMREEMARLAGPNTTARSAVGGPAAPVDESYQTVRVRIEELDALFQAAGEAGGAAARLQHGVDLIDQALARTSAAAEAQAGSVDTPGETLIRLLQQARAQLAGQVADVSAELVTLQELTAELRLVEARVLADEMERAAREVAQSVGKQVAFSSSGQQTRVDAHVLASLRGPLRHLVGNAIAHGIEAPAERSERGKAEVGLVELTVERRGQRVAISCRDDGRGMDLDSLREAALQQGLATADESRTLTPDRLIDLASRGGLSTAGEVTAVAGRGMGLDIARTAVEQLKGEMNIRTEAGQGTTVELLVPISLVSLPALAVRANHEMVLLPLDAVVRTLRFSEQEISRSKTGLSLLVDHEAVPFLPLNEALGAAAAERDPAGAATAVVIRAGEQQAALGVDQLGGVCNVLVQSVPASAQADAIIAGAAVDVEGLPQLVLGPPALIQMALSPRSPGQAKPRPEPTRVLVIDDSLTTRMMEQSILESAGYIVDLAVSGEDALQQARARAYDLFLVDVEMPGMSGFDFIARARADAALADIPAILVSSRASDEDKLRGKKAGARAYIVKSEFDQRELLATIQRLVD